MTNINENITAASPINHNHSSTGSSISQRLSWSPTTMVYDERRNNSLPVKLNDPTATINYHQQYHGDRTSSAIPSLSPTANEETPACCNTNHKEKYDDSGKSLSSQEQEYSEKRLFEIFRDRIPNVYTKYSQSLLLENKASVARDHLGMCYDK